MKIVIVQGPFFPVPPVKGGAVEKRWFQLAKEFIKKDNEVIYLCKKYPGMPPEESIEGIKFFRKSGFNFNPNSLVSNFYDLIYSLNINRMIPNDADVIITNCFWSPVLMKKGKRIKTIVDVARMPKGQMKLYKGVRILRANSTPVAEAIKQELNQTLHHKVKTIPNPIPYIIDADTQVPEKENIILYTGRIHPEKGIHLLLESFKKVDENHWKLIVVGPYKESEGGGGEKYLNTLKAIAGDAVVEFPGLINDIDQLNDYYQKASVFVYPSLAEKGETFGLAPLEAMSWGTVPIVSDLLCFKDFISDGVNGFVFDHRSEEPIVSLSKKLASLMRNNKLREEMSVKAKEVRISHSVEGIAAKFLNMFKEHDENNS